MPPEDSPTARALRTLELLQLRPGASAAELSERLGVTERAARRYVAILREAGVPVESVRGPHGGYRLGRGARLPPVVFTAAEALALVMAVLDSAPAAAGDELVGPALDKVVRALPPGVSTPAAALRRHAATTPTRDPSRPDPELTSRLVSAVAERRRVRLDYRSEPGNQWSAEVDPWAVVVRHGRWYLLCHSHRAGATRTYRLDRVGDVELTTQRFTPPADLDPVAALEENLATGWAHPTRVVFDEPPDVVARWVRPPMGRLEPHGTGTLLTGSTSNPTMYAAEWLAAVPLDYRVEGGAELRGAVDRLARRLRAAVDPPADRPAD